MSRKRKPHPEPLPAVGHLRDMWSLPRDVRLGAHGECPPGSLLCGWCEATETRQLWEVVENSSQKATARFVGFVRNTWEG